MTKNFDAFIRIPQVMQKKYEGQYIVMIDGKIITHGREIDKILPGVMRKYPKKIPLVSKIPKAEAMIL